MPEPPSFVSRERNPTLTGEAENEPGKLIAEADPNLTIDTAAVAEKGAFSTREPLLRFFELALVLWIAVGDLTLHSIYPLMEHGSQQTYRLLAGLGSWTGLLGLFGYVLFARRGVVSGRVPIVRTIPISGLLLVVAVGFVQFGLHPLFDLAAGLNPSDSLLANANELRDILSQGVGLAVLAYVLRRRAQHFADIGLHWSTGGAVLAIPLCLVSGFLYSLQSPAISWLGQTFASPGWTPPDVAGMLFPQGMGVLQVPAQVVNGFFEELIVRAWLMTEVMRVSRKPWIAAAISVIVQVSYHFYQGVPLALSHIAWFALLAIFYARTRLILPVALAHTLVDLRYCWHQALGAEF